jgi:hypothetical protein
MSYMAIVLTEEAHNELVSRFSHLWEKRGWKTYAHHMTLHMGKPRPEEIPLLGTHTTLTIDAMAHDEMVVAVKATPWGVQSDNNTPHITLAVNRDEGGKPVMSNKLQDWEDVEPFNIRGRIEEVKA